MLYDQLHWFDWFVVDTGLAYDNFLLVSDPFRQSLHQVDLAHESVWRLPLTSQQLKYVDYDEVGMTLYGTDNKFIQRAALNGTQEEPITARYQGNL